MQCSDNKFHNFISVEKLKEFLNQQIEKYKNIDNLKCPKRCSGQILYQCGYKDGQKAGLQQGHDMIEKLLKEQQVKMDKLLAHEGEE